MRVVFLGCTKYSEALLRVLLEVENIDIPIIFSIPEYFDISYRDDKVKNTNYADLSGYASSIGADYYLVNSKKGQRLTDYRSQIKAAQPDVILALGWYYMIPASIRKIAHHGAWGIHASLLPEYAGGAPLVWAMIEGEKETGVTLFRMEDGVDDGDIIMQKSFPIEEPDTIREVYDKATEASAHMLRKAFEKPEEIRFKPQDKSLIRVYPQRSPEDGRINWSWSNERIRNFIRAQTKPYPGAWTIINGKKVIIWDAEIMDDPNA